MIHSALIIAGLAALANAAALNSSLSSNPEASMTQSQIITYWGYPVMEYTVVAADGFHLNMVRIPFGINEVSSPKNTPRPAVLLQHGILDAGTTWILNLPHQSLGFILADKGFDVWIGNNRGNTYSKPNCSTTACWDFTFDEMVTYDLPAFIDFILEKTGQESIGYVGHSQGTVQAFAAFSRNDDLQKKVNLFVALAPVTYIYHQQAKLLNVLADFEIDKLFLLFGVKDFLPSSALIRLIGDFCPLSVVDSICENLYFLICGSNPESQHNFNQSRLDVYVSHTPAGTSVRNMAHWAQMIRTNRFGSYDYGTTKNKKIYGQSTPPDYVLSNVKLPVALFHGGQDLLGDPIDEEVLETALSGNGNIVFNQKLGDYAHLDFIWGLDAHTLIYPNVVDLLTQYASTSTATSATI